MAGQEREWRDGYSAFELPNSTVMTLCILSSLLTTPNRFSPPYLSSLYNEPSRIPAANDFLWLPSSWRIYQHLPSRLVPISFTLNEVPNFILPLPSNSIHWTLTPQRGVIRELPLSRRCTLSRKIYIILRFQT